MADQKYPGCWYCDNIIDHPEQVGLLYLGFPRCFVLIPSIGDFYFSTYEEFLNGLCKVNWLDPSNKGTREEQEEVLRILWNKKKKKRNYMEIMMNDRERIGKKLAEIRSEKGYTVRQLAELADLRPATISNVENGKFSVGIDILTKICNTLGARIEIVKE